MTLVVTFHRRAGTQHIEDEPFLNGLLHGVAVEGAMLNFSFGVCRHRDAEQFKRLVFWRGSEGEVARSGQ